MVGGQEAIPDKASVQVNLAVTFELFHLAALAAGVSVVVTTGAVLSSLTIIETLAVFPALSVAVPLTVWLAICVLTVTGAVHVAIPDVLSAQVNVTTTLLLFQPAALGAGCATPVIVGRSVSVPTILTEIEELAGPRTVTVMVLDNASVTAFVTAGLV